jgi:hypothetical protein
MAFPCTVCGVLFKKISRLNFHLKLHRANEHCYSFRPCAGKLSRKSHMVFRAKPKCKLPQKFEVKQTLSECDGCKQKFRNSRVSYNVVTARADWSRRLQLWVSDVAEYYKELHTNYSENTSDSDPPGGLPSWSRQCVGV